MSNFESDVIELGSASTETQGTALIGPEDLQPGGKRFVGGIESID